MSDMQRQPQENDREKAVPQAAHDAAPSPQANAAQAQRSRMPPPLPFLLGLLLGWGCDALRSWPITSDPRIGIATIAVGALVAVVALVLVIGSGNALARQGTSADPSVESVAIVASGPFAFSRNPIYLALALLQIAVACFSNNVWMLLMLVPAVIVVDRIVIVGEERYLASRFGRVYLDYASRVRRWL
jgi:protein-S-isoprenylcysteine O-methyltransferase Ste14